MNGRNEHADRDTPNTAEEEVVNTNDDEKKRREALSIMNPDGAEDFYNYKEEPILLPQSTNSLLYTEPICSIAFNYSLVVFLLSTISLMLTMANNLNGDDCSPSNPLCVPVQVDTTVRVAQYVAIMVGLLMEEEIPSSFYLLQMIPKHSLREKLPPLKYWRFLTSAILRLANGYLFIFNMFLVVAQGNGVLEIFYDCLALQFLQVLDNIAFGIAKLGSFGKHLKQATNRKIFLVEFEKPPFYARKRTSLFVKILYIVNLVGMFGGMMYVSFMQMTGILNCDSIQVVFPDDIWQDAIVKSNSGETIISADLIYSYFNGVYKRNGTYNGLPVYTEQSKILAAKYEETVGAEIKYCKSEDAWVFMHPNIRKSEQDDNDCPWLLRSPSTSEYNLLDVTGYWTVWAGSQKKGGEFSALCSECSDTSECNFHGQCVDKQCICTDDKYFGNHCEHKKPCQKLRGDAGDLWSVRKDANGEIILAYDRPTYNYEGGFNILPDGIAAVLAYTGSRWFAMRVNATNANTEDKAAEFHAFWNQAYNNLTTFVSDPATETSPIAVDFYNITDRGPRYGPLGQLTPLTSPKGSGYFQCDDDSD